MRIRILAALLLFALLPIRSAVAHPMGNFAICHYARFTAEPTRLHLRYILDFAEIPTVAEKERLDRNRDGIVTNEEKGAYLDARAPELREKLRVLIDGKPATLEPVAESMALAPGAGGLDTLKVRMDLDVSLPAEARHVIQYSDGNFPGRTGWKEIVAAAGDRVAITESDAGATDRSQELTAYPTDRVPPQQVTARFTVTQGGQGRASGGSVSAALTAHRATTNAPTPRDAFTQAISAARLTPGLMFIGLLAAFVAGALHALSPGHGKAMVAAYLVGARGTARHAIALGLIVTFTHTAGVFALGLATLLASRYIVPEQLYPWLSALSGAAVCGVGLWLLVTRLRGLADDHHHHHDHSHDHDHYHEHVHSGHHHHVPNGPVTARSILAMGVSGGIVPCPSALIVLLAAIHLHRVLYGMALITAFSAGLAAVLVVIGLLVVRGRDWLDRLPAGGPLMRRLPVLSAAAVTLIGLFLVLRSFSPGGF